MAGLLFLFAPGAGAPSSHPWMQRWVRSLQTIGMVRTLDYPYMLQQRKRPDRLPTLLAAHRAALEKARKNHVGPIILIGKSIGSRVGCHLALEVNVHGVICLGYPLFGMGDAKKVRDEVLLQLRTPILFVQGTRDSLCPLAALQKVRRRMKALNRLEVVQDGDHSLAVAKRTLKARSKTQTEIEDQVVLRIIAFVEECSKLATKGSR